MALNEKVVEGWRYPDARPELDAIREDVLALLRGDATQALKTEVAELQKALAEMTVERDALAGRVLEVEEMLAAEEELHAVANGKVE